MSINWLQEGGRCQIQWLSDGPSELYRRYICTREIHPCQRSICNVPEIHLGHVNVLFAFIQQESELDMLKCLLLERYRAQGSSSATPFELYQGSIRAVSEIHSGTSWQEVMWFGEDPLDLHQRSIEEHHAGWGCGMMPTAGLFLQSYRRRDVMHYIAAVILLGLLSCGVCTVVWPYQKLALQHDIYSMLWCKLFFGTHA